MKKFILFFILTVAVTAASAYEENYWPRSYFVRAGMGVTATIGDLNERPVSVKDTNGNKFKTYPPDMALMGDPELLLGVNIREFTLAVAFQYWKQQEELVKISAEESTSFWRLGFEFYYNFFWPDYFQVGLGAGFSYTSCRSTMFVTTGSQSARHASVSAPPPRYQALTAIATDTIAASATSATRTRRPRWRRRTARQNSSTSA